MNILELLEKREEILELDKKAICPECKEEYFSPFDRLYIAGKGKCFLCDEDLGLANNILNNL